MITARKTLRYLAGTAVLAAWAAFGSVQLASAQMTPEGTTIRNTASVSFTDANNNPYTAATAYVDVLVGFKPGIDVTAAAATVTPAAPSTGNMMPFTLTNTGNGPDTMLVTIADSNPGIITITGYEYNGTTYPTLAALNGALDNVTVPAGGSILINVIYDVPNGSGGSSTTITLTDTSQRDPTIHDADATTVSPPATGTISVTPDGTPTEYRLPSNATTYSTVFTVHNNENTSDTFSLLASSLGAAVVIVSVDGNPGSTGTPITIPAAGTQTVTVVYTVNDVAAGTMDEVRLVATSTRNNTITDPGWVPVEVIKPALTTLKQAYKADQTTLIGAGDKVIPGDVIWYKISVTNNGTADAQNVVVTDDVPTALNVVSTADDGTPGWTITTGGNLVTGTLSGMLAPAATRFIWIQTTVK